MTGDRELSPMRDVLAGGRLSWISSADEGRPLMGFAEEFELHLNAEGIWFQLLTETAPGGDVTGPIPDAITVQLGAQLR